MHISRAATSDAGRELAEQRFASGSQLAGLGVGVDRQRHRRAMDVPCGDDVHRVPLIEHEASGASTHPRLTTSNPTAINGATASPVRFAVGPQHLLRHARCACSSSSYPYTHSAAIRVTANGVADE